MNPSLLATSSSARRQEGRFAPYAPAPAWGLAEELDATTYAAMADLASLDARLPGQVERYLEQHREWPTGWTYNRVPEPVRTTIEGIRERGGATLLGAFHRAAICSGLRDTRRRTVSHARWSHSLPDFDYVALRIVRSLMDTSDADLDYTQDRFAKDIALATGRVWVTRAQTVGPRRGIERSRLAHSGVATILRATALLAKMGGHYPLYEMHTYHNLLDQFTEEGWADCYRAVARALLHDPIAKGVFSTAWYFDPALGEVSPRLAYLHRFPAERGAVFLKVRNTAQGVRSALARSATRRRLFEEGGYHPQEYLLVWPRDAMLTWLRAGGR